MDILARLLAEPLSRTVDRPVIVENIAGGGTVIATRAVLDRPANGNTLYLTTAALVTAPAMNPDAGYDPSRDFTTVLETTNQVMVVAANAKLGLSTMDDLLAYMKEHPNATFFASAGVGSASHLSAHTYFKRAGIEATHVPFQGSGAAIPEVISGRVPVIFDGYSSSLPFQRSGDLSFLAQTPANRSELLPDLPTVSESLPGYGFDSWHAVFVRSGTPQATVDYLADSLEAVLKEPAVSGRLAELGMEIRAARAKEFLPRLEEETEVRAALVEELGLK